MKREVGRPARKPASIARQLVRVMALSLMLLFLVLSVLLYVYTVRSVTAEYRTVMTAELAEGVQAINQELSLYVNQSRFLVNTYILNGIRAYLTWDPVATLDFHRYMQSLAYMTDMLRGHNGIRFLIAGYDGEETQYIAHLEPMTDQPALAGILEESIETVRWDQRLAQSPSSQEHLLLYRNITSYINHPGVMELEIPYARIRQTLEALDVPPGAIVTHDADAGLISGFTKVPGVPAGSLSDQDALAMLRDAPLGDWLRVDSRSLVDGSRLTIAIPKGFIRSIYYKRLLLLGAAILACLLAAVAAVGFTTGRITGRLNRFIQYLRSEQDFLNEPVRIDLDGRDEITLIKQRFLEVIAKMQTVYHDYIEERQQNSRLQLDLLQARINPHLLYNSLSVIRWSALRKADTQTVEIVDALTDYYRLALNKGEEVIRLSRELEMVSDYVKVLNFTHARKNRLEIELDQTVLACGILKHLIQPLVENAILHGLNGVDREGVLRISGTLEDHHLLLVVQDNGCGMPQTRLDALNALPPSGGGPGTSESGPSGYGLRNLKRRIALQYDETCGLQVESRQGEGTTVTLRLGVIPLGES